MLGRWVGWVLGVRGGNLEPVEYSIYIYPSSPSLRLKKILLGRRGPAFVSSLCSHSPVEPYSGPCLSGGARLGAACGYPAVALARPAVAATLASLSQPFMRPEPDCLSSFQ